jgi:hypothetical protein
MKGYHVLPTALLVLSASSSFQAGRPLDQLPLPVPPEKRVEVWSKGERFQLHAVTVDADSVRGVRWWHSPTCDSCRVAIARTAVDSIRTLGHDSGKTGVFILIATPIALLIGITLLFLTGPDNGEGAL